MAYLLRLYQQNPTTVQLAAVGFILSLLLYNGQRLILWFRGPRDPLEVRAADTAAAIEKLIVAIGDEAAKNHLTPAAKDALAEVRLHGLLLRRWIAERK